MDDIIYVNDKNTNDLLKSTYKTFKIKPRLRNINLKVEPLNVCATHNYLLLLS